jgi:hypothetical protein
MRAPTRSAIASATEFDDAESAVLKPVNWSNPLFSPALLAFGHGRTTHGLPLPQWHWDSDHHEVHVLQEQQDQERQGKEQHEATEEARAFNTLEPPLPLGFVFASFNKAKKISPTIFSCWCQVLLRTPGSVLWLTSAGLQSQRQLRAEAAAHGLSPNRLVFGRYLPSRHHHQLRVPLADLALDTLEFNAG